jgi:murein DD-endopeptidase MepM/ murein hydrolase activator NlpD
MQTLSGGANGGVGNLLGGLGNMIGPAIMLFGSKAWSSLSGLFKGGADGMFAKASEWAKGAWGKVADASKGFWANAGNWAKGAWDKVAGWGKGVWDWVKGLFGGGAKAAPGAGLAGARTIPIIGTLATILSLSGDTAKADPNAPAKPKTKPFPFSPSFGVDPSQGNSSPLDDLFGGGGQGGDGQLYGMGDSGTVASPADGYQNKITSSWGKIRHLVIDGKKVTTKPHGGMDIGIPEGTSVKAVKDGTVIHTGYNPDGFGNNVIIQHDDGYQTVYAHLSSKSMQKGDKVTAGQLVGLSGNTGFSSGPHLHFQVQKGINGKTYDPAAYLSGSKDVTASGVHSGSTEDIVSRSLFSSSSGSLFSGVNSSDGTGGSESTDPTILPVGSGSRGGNNVTVNINVPASASINEQTLAREVKRILQEDERVKMAVNR